MNGALKLAFFACAVIATACSGNPSSDSFVSLPPDFALEATATAGFDGTTVECHIDYLAELTHETARTESLVLYVGTMGGEAGRAVLAPDGSGIALRADAFSEISVELRLPDQVTITAINLPPSEPLDPPGFWDEVVEFRGTLAQNGTISGEWTCAPFYTRGDEKHYVAGTWFIRPQ